MTNWSRMTKREILIESISGLNFELWSTEMHGLRTNWFYGIALLKTLCDFIIILLILLWRKRPGNINKYLTFLRAFTFDGLLCVLNLNTCFCNYFIANASKFKRKSLIGSFQYGQLCWNELLINKFWRLLLEVFHEYVQ